MPSLAQRLAARPSGAVLVTGPSRQIAHGPQPPAVRSDLTCVGICVTDSVEFVRTLLALDGRVETLVLLSHALSPEVVSLLLEKSGCTSLVSDRSDLKNFQGQVLPPDAVASSPGNTCETTWMLTTSGTTGIPKLIPHTLNSLTRTVARGDPKLNPRWGLLYDPTRFAGLQVVLQALIGGGELIAPDTSQSIADQVSYLHQNKCTHLSATPTLWRRLLMAPGFSNLALRQLTLGGEIVDQQVLDTLRAAHPNARITHIYASTEAGVGFAVTDGKAGFPHHFLRDGPSGISMKIVDDVLWLRPPSNAQRSLAGTDITVDSEGFIRSGDQILLKSDRALFLGRDNGTINVGGVKVYPEMVEQTLMQVSGVQLARVSSKKSPIAGALIVADVQPLPGGDTKALKKAIQTHCKARLDREAVPAIIRFVDGLTLNAAGKLIRTDDPK